METTTYSDPATVPHATPLYAQVDQYPWDSDVEFQSGLTAILGTNSSPEQAVELTLRARCFYYSRKFNADVEFNAYKAYREQSNSSCINGIANTIATTNSSIVEPAQSSVSTLPLQEQPQDAPYPMSFTHIVELIQSGQPIPGIKDIPPTVLEGQGTAPSKARRKKPWEKEEAAAQPAA